MLNKDHHPQLWSSRAVFFLASIGAAVGLGNIWKFPYTTGVSGGGAFVIIYILAIFIIAIPIVMAELMIGRRGRRSPVSNFRILAGHASASPAWRFVGWMNITAVFLILTFYSVIAGWALAYIPKLASGLSPKKSSAQPARNNEKIQINWSTTLIARQANMHRECPRKAKAARSIR